MRELYIYYRVAEAHAASAHAAVIAMQADLRRAHPQLRTRLLRRADTVGEPQTWMETYAVDATGAGGASSTDAPHGIGATLQAAIELAALALQPWLASPRHVEAFEAFTACAS
jgi:hypothetical protein